MYCVGYVKLLFFKQNVFLPTKKKKNVGTMSHCTTQFNMWPSEHLWLPQIAQHF